VRALILHGAGDLRLDDVPEPSPGPGEVVLRVVTALTCATDAKMMRAGAHPALGALPAPLGHEVVGVVDAVGAGVARPRIGDEVVVANSAPCGRCAVCRSGAPNLCPEIVFLTGAFAERLRVPAAIVARNTHPVPAGLAPEVAAFAEPLACALHSVRRCGPGGGREVLVLGGGVQGQLLARLLTLGGDRVHLADPHADRRARALRLGAVAAHDAPRDAEGARLLAGRLTGGRGADLVVEAVGRPATWSLAPALARPGGEVLLHGGCPPGSMVELDTGRIHYSEITLRGSFHHTPDVFREALFLLAAGEIAVGEFLHAPIGLEDVAASLAGSPGDKHPVRPAG
jgi:L-iditol 2-dehydrogenase